MNPLWFGNMGRCHCCLYGYTHITHKCWLNGYALTLALWCVTRPQYNFRWRIEKNISLILTAGTILGAECKGSRLRLQASTTYFKFDYCVH